MLINTLALISPHWLTGHKTPIYLLINALSANMIHRRSVCQVPVHRRSVLSACTDINYLLQLQQSLEMILKLSVQNTTSGMNFWYVWHLSSNVF